MKFSTKFESTSGERKDCISTLDADEIATVERVRRIKGNEVAGITAAALVLKSVYTELDAIEWNHMGAPEPMN